MARKIPVLRVLVVDDEPLIRWALTETLADCGHLVEEASDGTAALAKAAASGRAFDIVLLDFRLPDSNDLALLGELHAMMPAAQIIMMTAHVSSELFQQARDRGAYRVVNKPFELGAIAELVLQAHTAASA
jgi:DNA-binding NtrC family response regulator